MQAKIQNNTIAIVLIIKELLITIMEGEKMKKCPKCGTTMPDDANFCTHCGAKLSNESVKVGTTNDSPETHQESEQSQTDQQSNQCIINTEQTKKIATNYWKWLVKSWAKPTNIDNLSSKWFGIASIVLETFLLCISFFALVQRITIYINSITNSIADAISSFLNGYYNSDLHLNAFGISVEIFIVLLLLNAAVIGSAYGINCWVFKEKESIWHFINRFAHYTNIILISNFILFLLCMITNAYGMISMVTSFSIFIYILGMLATTLDRRGIQRIDGIYGSVFIGLIILVSVIIFLLICGV